MSGSEQTGEIRVRSRFGPIRIELLDNALNRRALGFGQLQARVPAGLYALQCSAGAERHEEIVRVVPGQTVEREIALRYPALAPISVSSTTHEFHENPAVEFSRQLQLHYGTGGGLMIFIRTIDGDGRARIPIDRLSLWDSSAHLVAELAADADRNGTEGWACLAAHVTPGGYTLRWRQAGRSATPPRPDSSRIVDQPLWISSGWTTIAFIGYASQADRLERQTASLHMTRLGTPFQPGTHASLISSDLATESELAEARVNQALDLALSGIRTGNHVVPDDLLDLLALDRVCNPMLGIVSAHAILQRRPRDWTLFDAVVQQVDSLVPGHPDVSALRWSGDILRGRTLPVPATRLSWPPMMQAGYRACIESDWKLHGELIEAGSLAERAAAMLLPEWPWTSCIALDAPPAESEAAVGRVSRHIARLHGDEDVDLRALSLEHFSELGLPVAGVESALRTLASRVDASMARAARDTVASLTPRLRVDSDAIARIVESMDALDSQRPPPEREADKPFMMAIDRVFDLSRGIVVTGRIERGRVRVGDTLDLIGDSPLSRQVEVSGVEMYKKVVDQAEAGDNVGLAVLGVDASEIRSGQVLAAARSIRAHTRFNAEFHALSEEEGGSTAPLFGQVRSQFHIGAIGVMGTFDLAEGLEAIKPGESRQMSAHLVTPTPLAKGSRFTIVTGGRIVGSGRVTEILE